MCSSLPRPFSSSRPADQPHAHHYQDEDRWHYRDQWGEAEYQTRWTQQVLEDAETEAHQHPGEYPLAERTERSGPKMKEMATNTSAAVVTGCSSFFQKASQYWLLFSP